MASRLIFRTFLSMYSAILTAGLPLIRCYQRKRIRQGKETPGRILERDGISSIKRPAGEILWVHGASIGEALAALPVIEQIVERQKDVWVVLTTGTVTSAEVLTTRLPERTIHQFTPLDRSVWVSAFLDHWTPSVAIRLESEFWPVTLWTTHKRTIPQILLNGRMSESSYKRWRFARFLIEGMLSCFDACLAQSPDDAARLQDLGARSVKSAGNLKMGASPLPFDTENLETLKSALGARHRWLLASTHDGEESIAGDIHEAIADDIPDLLTFIIPRHPDRGHTIANMLRHRGFTVAQRSLGETPESNVQFYIADTIGELGLFLRLCPIVFMGKSLVTPGGGQNPLEAARIGCSIIFGPNMSNFTDLSRDMVDFGAAKQVPHARALTDEVRHQLGDHEEVQSSIDAACRFMDRFRNVVDDSVGEVLAIRKM